MEIPEDYLWEWIEYLSQKHDGHFTLMKFTTHWKAMFFTPDTISREGREVLNKVPSAKTKEEALLLAIRDELRGGDRS